MTQRLLQLSGVVVDLLYDVQAVPAPGDEAVVTGFALAPGGGFNAMIAAKRAGLEVSYGGALGTGPFAAIVRDGLISAGIPHLLVPDTARDQGCCTVLIDPAGERTFVASDGAEGHVTADDLAQATAVQANWTLLSGYTLYYSGARAAMTDWLRNASHISNLVIDPSPMAANLPRGALDAACARAKWISANRREATSLTGIRDPKEAAIALARHVPPDGGAVVRDGERGCILATQGACVAIPAFAVEALDTNGAGDTHVGSFIARLAQGDTAQDAARYANIAAALSTTRKGPATAPERAVVTALLARQHTGEAAH